MDSNKLIAKTKICEMIPHDGLMCLLDQVTHWDDKHIICSSYTHQDSFNPLRSRNRLAVYALIEYAAQAMAVHGCLLANRAGKTIQKGYLAALREVTLEDCDVSRIQSELNIEATLHIASQGNMIYYFSVKTNNKNLISGRATVVAKP